MPVPYLGNSIKGWCKPTTFNLVVQSVVDHKMVETLTVVTLNCNLQPLPPWQVDRKPLEQRTWVWWSIIIKQGPKLKTDDILTKEGVNFRITKGGADWSESGFTKYEAIQDFQDPVIST